MSNAAEHTLGALAIVGLGHCALEASQGELTPAPLMSGALASLCASLPDIIEPAIHPHHRQFFHSVAFAGLLVALGIEVYRWKPEKPFEQIVRAAALIAGASYLAHLVMDARTPRSIPLVGRLS